MSVVVEGDTDIPFVRKLALDARLEIDTTIDSNGKTEIDRLLGAYNAAAKGSPWFVLRDLDRDSPCAADFLRSIKFAPATWMCFRIAEREVESWLLADHDAVRSFFRPSVQIPSDPDILTDPTQALVNLARSSTNSRIRRAMVPRAGMNIAVVQETIPPQS